MKTTLDCYSCFLRQALEGARTAQANSHTQDAIVRSTMGYLLGCDHLGSPVNVARAIQEIIHECTGVNDPYAPLRARSHQTADNWRERIEPLFENHDPDSLDMAVRVAVAGNIIDYGPRSDFNLDNALARCMRQPFAVNAGKLFYERLEQAQTLAYLTDNTGEILFDSLLMRRLMRDFKLESIKVVVRERPFLNDALKAEALALGLGSDSRFEILEMGPGIPKESEPAYAAWQTVQACDVRLAKGQANAEVFDEIPDFFLLFLAKCEQVARIYSEKSGTPIKNGDMLWVHTG